MSIDRRGFASDNQAGICPEAWEGLRRADAGRVPSYGEDDGTATACRAIAEMLGCDCDVYFVFNGTAANGLALATLCQSCHAVICPDTAHVETDECGAPEFFSNGSKLLTVRGVAGKAVPAAVEELVQRRSDLHFPKPKVLSLSQSTELGTVYTPAELLALRDVADRQGLRIHMDGARFANAVAALGCHPADISWRAGVDVLCLGGTKQGMPVGEAVVFFDRELSKDFAWRCKQAGQLASKMRYLAAPWPAMLGGGVWLRHAERANACARRLGAGLAAVPGIEVLHPVQANAVFVRLPPEVEAALRARGWLFYTFIGGGARFICGWDCQEAWVDALIADLAAVSAGAVAKPAPAAGRRAARP